MTDRKKTARSPGPSFKGNHEQKTEHQSQEDISKIRIIDQRIIQVQRVNYLGEGQLETENVTLKPEVTLE